MDDTKSPLDKLICAAKDQKAGTKMNETNFYKKMDLLDACLPQYRPSKELISLTEKSLDVCFGPQLKEYLERYGFLLLAHRFFLGLDNVHGIQSSLVVGTLRAWESCPELSGKIVIDNALDLWIFAVDQNDTMYVYCLESGYIIPMHMKFFDYLIEEYNQWHELPPDISHSGRGDNDGR